jgi:hypothetical protein
MRANMVWVVMEQITERHVDADTQALWCVATNYQLLSGIIHQSRW